MSTTPVTVETLLDQCRDIHAEIDMNEPGVTSARSKHLVWVADHYQHLAELLRQHPTAAEDIGAAAELLVQARALDPDRGGAAALQMARTRGSAAATAGKLTAEIERLTN